MKDRIVSLLKTVVPLGIGIFVIWYQYDQLSEDQLRDIRQSFQEANYFWVGISVLFGLTSHMSRAYRWKYTLEPLGYQTRYINNFFAVMIGYVANIILPRFGEVWRCVMVTRYEKGTEFQKLFGTVVAERVADMLVLLLIIFSVVIMQLSRLRDSIAGLLETHFSDRSAASLAVTVLIGLVAAFTIAIVLWKVLQRSSHPVSLKIKDLLRGLLDGILSITRMKGKWWFLLHTAFIWIMYLTMYYVPFLALDATSGADLSAVLASFVMASFSIVLVQGGIGVYPVAVAQTLVLYNIPYEAGFAMGWIIWVAQTIMIVTFGAASLILMPLMNRKTSVTHE